MTHYSEIRPSDPCSHCGAPIGHIHVNLRRNEERLAKPGANNHLDVENAQVLYSYCMKCGVNAARNDLMNIGFVPHVVEDYENTCVCTSCGTAPIDMYEWHPTYLIAVKCFSEQFGFGTAEETVVVISCAECEAKYGPSKQRLLKLVLSKRGLAAL